jgi:hypothetical protein
LISIGEELGLWMCWIQGNHVGIEKNKVSLRSSLVEILTISFEESQTRIKSSATKSHINRNFKYSSSINNKICLTSVKPTKDVEYLWN